MCRTHGENVLRFSIHVIMLIPVLDDWVDRSRDTWKGEVTVVYISAV